MTTMTGTKTTKQAMVGVAGQPCSANRMWRRGRQGHLYLTDAASAWELAIVADVRQQLDWQRLRATWQDAGQPPLAVDLTFYGVRGDLDNYAKCSLDGLKHALGIDDRHFAPITLHLGERLRANGQRQPPGARIEIRFAAPEQPEQPEQPATSGEPPHAAGSLRVRDLLDDAVIERLLPPVTHVRVYPAFSYGGIAMLFPPSPLNADDGEWGTFLPLAQARELRDALDGVLANAAPAGS